VTHGLDTSFLVAVELTEHPSHAAARLLMTNLIARGERLGLAPQVLAEFIHISTDPRRFQRPLDIVRAREFARQWWTAREVDMVFPTAAATEQFLEWMVTHQLGRKRLLDTLLAATYLHASIYSVLTLNSSDFRIFGFLCLDPADAPTHQ
jgi:predicted nucleic acid-binding protein